MSYDNRILRSENVKVSDIVFNPGNWRIHPSNQRKALDGILTEIGWVQQVIINQTTGNLIDGHLRVLLAAENEQEEIPAIIVELSQDEEDKILTTFDPVNQMAVADKKKLYELIKSVKTNNEQINALLNETARKEKILLQESDEKGERLNSIDDIVIEDPTNKVSKNDIYRLGEHVLACCEVVDSWSNWINYLTDDMLLLPYPGVYVFAIKIKRSMLLIQPNEYIASQLLDHYIYLYGDTMVEKL